MANNPWTDEENDLIVADYFTMLAADLVKLPYNKAAHNRELCDRIHRGRGSIEYKHQNISAVLKGLGESWTPGYRPAFNFQTSLVNAVVLWLDRNPDYFPPANARNRTTGIEETAVLVVGPPPTLSNEPPPDELKQTLEMARRFDVAGRDERNRALGRAGEERVRWVSAEEGDGAAYDIASFSPEGRNRLIEVKTTNGWERTPFHITRNELAVAERWPAAWHLLRLWNFVREPKAFELRPPLSAHVTLIATSFEARFN